MNKLTDSATELIGIAKEKNSVLAEYVQTLLYFDVVGFLYKDQLRGMIKFLTEEKVDFDYNEKKLLLWLPTLSENLKKMHSKNW